MDEHPQTPEYARQTAIGLPVQFDPQVVAALPVLSASCYVGRWLGRLGAHPKFLPNPEPMTRVLTRSGSRGRIATRLWPLMAGFHTPSANITHAVLETFPERGMQMPFLQHEMRLPGTA